VNLGYPTAQAERVVAVAADEAGEGATTSDLIRLALKGLSR
jgi:Holliday junction resolvasome RuvABC DNA-binding subunit